MKLAIVGGRTFNDYARIYHIIKKLELRPSVIVSGGAPGADELAERFADEFNIEKHIIPADWENLDVEPCNVKKRKDGTKYNACAGFNRNTLIVEASDVILAFWNGKSSGTADTIDKARKAKKQTIVQYY